MLSVHSDLFLFFFFQDVIDCVGHSLSQNQRVGGTWTHLATCAVHYKFDQTGLKIILGYYITSYIKRRHECSTRPTLAARLTSPTGRHQRCAEISLQILFFGTFRKGGRGASTTDNPGRCPATIECSSIYLTAGRVKQCAIPWATGLMYLRD